MEVRALEDIDLSVSAGDLTALLGPSGSGKTTLLLCVSLILDPTIGNIIFKRQTSDFSGRLGCWISGLCAGRKSVLSSSPHLIPFLTVRQNVLLPLSLVGIEEGQRSIG